MKKQVPAAQQPVPAQTQAQTQPELSNEAKALHVLAKAAEKYLASLDELAQGPVSALLQEAVTILANVIAPKPAA